MPEKPGHVGFFCFWITDFSDAGREVGELGIMSVEVLTEVEARHSAEAIEAEVLKPDHLRVLAGIADDYSTGRGHLTTRENVQFHFVKLENVPATMRRLAAAGLTTREACGNTVRNVTACPVAGVCPGEAFDVTPYALGVSRYLLRHPDFHD